MRPFLLCMALALSCAPDSSSLVGDPSADETDVDQAGIATDRADRSCQVVLRHAERAAGTTGFETVCNTGGVCWFVWQATVDVATPVPTGATLWVQYRSTDASTWSRKQAARVAGGPAGYQRYAVRLDTRRVGPGMSPTSMQRARLDVLPYLRLADGSRVFDHNRVPGDLDAYALVINNQWAIGEDANACRPAGQSRAVLRFLSDWSERQHGPLIEGGTGVIEYDSNRLTRCRGSSGGRATWDITATVRFSPGGQQVEQSVRTFDALTGGFPDLSRVRLLPFNFTVPAGAQSAEVWFVNTGLSCPPTYDSNDSANYRFAVEPAAPAKIGWVGNAASSTSRTCTAAPGVAEPIVLDGYLRERACSFVELDVWAPGVTDLGRTELIAARADLVLDGVAQPAQWLELRGHAGNDARWRFELPRDLLWYGPKWSTLKYTLAFSTDGVVFTKDVERTVKRDVTWCNPTWGSCN